MKNVWLVDDNAQVREALEAMFRLMGYPCRTFNAAPPAVEALVAGEIPDLLFLDINMPGVSGIELLGFIRGRDTWKNLPVLMLTGETAENMVELAIRLGADGYVFKPVTYEQLEMAIPTAIERRRIAANRKPEDG